MPLQSQTRTWGTRFDTLLSSPSTELEDASADIPQDSPLIANEVCDDPKKSVRIAQDASVFIGSLPTNIEHSDLSHMLSDHLSDHPEVQTIKVVRDSKGGTCAFIQCQDAETAAILITNLRSSAPKQFMGRNLRYEPARAMRTLVASYCAPRQFPPFPDAKIGLGDLVELELPWAMKISRVPGTRRPLILYNSDARAAAEDEGVLPLDDHKADESGAYFYPLLYNAETLRKISTVFGRIEHFVSYDSGNQHEYPPPHDAPRSTGMDTGCWEIKWSHRDDSVNALRTLHRIPHLNVTWAHHSAQSCPSTQHHPVHTNWQTQANSFNHATLSRFPSPNRVSSVDSDALVLPDGVEQTSSSVSLGNSPNINRASAVLCDMTWSSQNVVLDTKHTSSKRPRALSLNYNSETRKLWGDRMEAADESSSLTSLPSMLRISSSAHFDTQVNQEEPNDVMVNIPPTREIGTSPVTPKTPESLIPRTPTTGSYLGDFQSRSLPEFTTGGVPRWNEKREDPLDPTTVFVGGLEMYGPNAWNEERVRNLFSRYGIVESVKFVRPVNKRSAFAFVKFNNKESSARAIGQEHNRIIDGRPIRVQLRDWNPQCRGTWRSNHNHGFNTGVNIVSHESEPSFLSRNDFRVDPTLQRPTMVAALEDRLRDLNIGEETVTKVAQPDAEQSEEKFDVPPGYPQPLSSVTDDEPTTNFGDAVSPPVTLVTPIITRASPTSFELSHQVTTMGYYHPQGWATGFPTYPMQYMGAYPGYPLPPPVSQSLSPASGSDGDKTPSPFIPPFIPYHPYPARTPVREQGQGQTPSAMQAPLIPTGFIQGDQGILVPIYPQDALDQYMSGARGEQSSTSANTPPPSLPGQPPNLWRPYHPPGFAPSILMPGVQHLGAGPFPIMGPQGWMSNQASFGMNQYHQSPTNAHPGSRGPHIQQMFEQRGTPSRRQYRKGNQPHIKNGGRGQPGRYPQGSSVPNSATSRPAHFTGSKGDTQSAFE